MNTPSGSVKRQAAAPAMQVYCDASKWVPDSLQVSQCTQWNQFDTATVAAAVA